MGLLRSTITVSQAAGTVGGREEDLEVIIHVEILNEFDVEEKAGSMRRA